MATTPKARDILSPNGTSHFSQHQPRLLPTTIDAIANIDPDRVLAEFLEAPHLTGGTFTLTFGVFARMVDRLAWWMSERCGKVGLIQFDTIALAGFLDLRHFAMLVAAMKCGYKILFCTLVSDDAARARLLQQAETKVFFTTQADEPLEPALFGDLPGLPNLPIFVVPRVEELILPGAVRSFPYTKTFAEASSDPVIVFHTSGTTGFPKPRVWTNSHVAVMDRGPRLPSFQGREVSGYYRSVQTGRDRTRQFCGLRCCYTSMVAAIGAAVFLDRVVVFLPFHASNDRGDRAASWLEQARCDEAIVFPSLLSLALESEQLLEQLAQLRKIYWVGAPLSWDVAHRLTGRAHLATLWGTTETGYLTSYETDAADWNYICVNTALDGVQWVEKAPNRFEMVVVRDAQATRTHPVFQTLPDLDEFTSGDLFSPHPSKPDHWRYEGRPDNLLVLNDMLFDPSGIEQHVERHPAVKSAIVLGLNYSVACLIVELYEIPQSPERAFQEVWPTVQKACEGRPKSQVVEARRVIVAQAEKPVPRNHKGEVKRAALADLYSDEMDACYK